MLKPRLLKQQAVVSISDMNSKVWRFVCFMYGACLGVCFVGEGLYFVVLVTCNFVLCAVILSDRIFTCVSSQINIVHENYCEVEVMDTVCELG